MLIDSHLTQCRFRAYKEEQIQVQKPKKDVAWGLTYEAYERARMAAGKETSENMTSPPTATTGLTSVTDNCKSMKQSLQFRSIY